MNAPAKLVCRQVVGVQTLADVDLTFRRIQIAGLEMRDRECGVRLKECWGKLSG